MTTATIKMAVAVIVAVEIVAAKTSIAETVVEEVTEEIVATVITAMNVVVLSTENQYLNTIKKMKTKNLIKSTLLSLFALQLLSASPVMGQTKKLTLEDLMPGGATYRFVDNLYNLQWWGDTCIKPTIDQLIGINPKDGKETVLTTKDKVNSVLEAANLGKITSFFFMRLPWKDRPEMVFPLHQKQIVYNFKTNEIVSTTDRYKDAANEDASYKSGNTA